MGFTITRSGSSLSHKLAERTRQRGHDQAEAKRLQDSLARGGRNDLLPKCVFEFRPVESIKPAARRTRKTPAAQLKRIIQSIRRFGFVGAILVRENQVVDGHARLEAAKKLSLPRIPCLDVEHLTRAEARLVALSMNRIAETGEWDVGELKLELEELRLSDEDLTVTGFSAQEVDILMQPLCDPIVDDDAQPGLPTGPTSRQGDLWTLGAHKLLCGDATAAISYDAILGHEQVHAIFTDCPWNLKIENNVSGRGKHKHQDFKMAAGEMSDEEFGAFVDRFTTLCAARLVECGAFFSCIDWRHLCQIVTSARAAGLTMINLPIWSKPGGGGMGALYRSAHELIPLFCKGSVPRTNNVMLGKHGRNRTNVWTYPGANRPGSSAAKALADHPTPKPEALVEDALLDVTNRGELVLDPFMGSGTTIIAAERSGRQARGIELDPQYVDVCIRRWEKMTGQRAVHAEAGVSFRELAAMRAAEAELDDHQISGG